MSTWLNSRIGGIIHHDNEMGHIQSINQSLELKTFETQDKTYQFEPSDLFEFADRKKKTKKKKDLAK